MGDNLWNLYLKAFHYTAQGELDAWTKLDITISQLKILMLLSYNKEMTTGQLAESLDVSLPNMTGIIDRLSQQGYLIRNKSEKDRRMILLKLSDKAEEKLTELKQSKHSSFHKIEASLSDIEKEVIKLGFKVFIDAIERAGKIT